MKNYLSKITPWVLVLTSILILGAIFIWSPVCTGLLELKNGNMTHMKCFYTGKASAILAIILLITSIAAFFTRNKSQWIFTVVAILVGVFLIAITYESLIGIGICKKDTMACHQTALWIRAGGVVSILGGIVMMFTKKDNSSKIKL